MKFSELLAELKADYLSILPERIANLEKLLKEKNWKQMHIEFHKLKGTGKTYGFPEVSTICEKLEEASRYDNRQAELAAGISELRKLLKQEKEKDKK